MPRGRPKGSKNKIHRDTTIVSTVKKVDRRVGRVISKEQKIAMQEGRKKYFMSKKKEEERILSSDKKPIMYYDGTEKDVFDFMPAMKNIFKGDIYSEIMCKIVKVGFYNPEGIKDTLKEYVSLEEKK